MAKFHSDEYVRFLRMITPDNMSEYTKQMQRFNDGGKIPKETFEISTDGTKKICWRHHLHARVVLAPKHACSLWLDEY